MTARVHAVRLGSRSIAALVLTSVVGLVAFTWPLVAAPHSAVVAHANDAPVMFAVLVPLLLVVVLAQVADGEMDAKAIAMLGVMTAVITALRPLGAGVAGLEPLWAILILSARALGPGFGFSLGAISMFTSALVTGGVGPWLPFQMIGAAWVGLGAGLLPRATGRREVVMLAGYAAAACLAYGFLLNLWFWPFAAGLPEAIAYSPTASAGINLVSWLRFSLVTSLGYDLPRAALAVVVILLAGRPVLAVLRRMARRATFHAAATFIPADHAKISP